ncbi:hypothetical protein CPB83DRAFT_809262 [Crepidotus variabilis]|uniref:MYND-type domain-containing protein n=1 Tax=Crepidotus variabilis TaxID=179855 RepID=A0A9P6EMV8_9AGAR|nr:hypothetical protein CPB83DRAFT_809262 [Crepidotus variabilis]
MALLDKKSELLPLISESILVHEEQIEPDVEKVRDLIFNKERDDMAYGPEGSFYQRWFRNVSQGKTAVKSWGINNKIFSRQICWKKGSKFDLDNLFSRTVDTSRILPMALADFRIQWYYHPKHLEWIDGHKKPGMADPRALHQMMTLSLMLFPILVMRNMHDYGGADIPIITVNWTSSMLDRAFDHWVKASESEWSDEECQERRMQLQGEFMQEQICIPCFLRVDQHVRALLSDEEVGYVPRFIVFRREDNMIPGRALFSHPSYQPDGKFIDGFPTGCGAPTCTDRDCVVFDFSACRALAETSPMVRKDKLPWKTVRCNFWLCEIKEEEGATEPCTLVRCKKCKEVMYCGQQHQVQNKVYSENIISLPW